MGMLVDSLVKIHSNVHVNSVVAATTTIRSVPLTIYICLTSTFHYKLRTSLYKFYWVKVWNHVEVLLQTTSGFYNLCEHDITKNMN